MKALLSPLHQCARQHPNQIALTYIHDGVNRQIDYSTLSQSVIALGEQLTAKGLGKGDRLACIDNNSIELVMLYWACIDHQILFCPLSPRFPASQVWALIELHRLNFLWTGEGFTELSSEVSVSRSEPNAETTKLTSVTLDFSLKSNNTPAQIDRHAPSNIILTSGSSGQPKAAVHSLNNHRASAEGSRSLISLEPGDSWLLSLPLFHIGGLAIINRCAFVGATVVLQDRDVGLSIQIQRDKITHLSLVSTQLVRLLKEDADSLKGVKYLLLGGGAISSSLLSQLNDLSINCFTSYGMTEMASQITTGTAYSDGSSGRLLPSRELKIIDEKIYVKGETLFLGYLDAQAQTNELAQTHEQAQVHEQGSGAHGACKLTLPTDEDGWFFTKDRGYWDTEGKLHILGRIDNMFICGGENLQPEEVEAALKQHPAIEDAIVFAQTDEEFGNLPAAIVKVSHSKNAQPSNDELTQFLADKIARFKRPRVYYPWPNVESASLKVSRKDVIEAVVQRELGSKS